MTISIKGGAGSGRFVGGGDTARELVVYIDAESTGDRDAPLLPVLMLQPGRDRLTGDIQLGSMSDTSGMTDGDGELASGLPEYVASALPPIDEGELSRCQTVAGPCQPTGERYTSGW